MASITDINPGMRETQATEVTSTGEETAMMPLMESLEGSSMISMCSETSATVSEALRIKNEVSAIQTVKETLEDIKLIVTEIKFSATTNPTNLALHQEIRTEEGSVSKMIEKIKAFSALKAASMLSLALKTTISQAFRSSMAASGDLS